jgi:hypothetical protein
VVRPSQTTARSGRPSFRVVHCHLLFQQASPSPRQQHTRPRARCHQVAHGYMTTPYRVRVSVGSHAYDPGSLLFRQTRHMPIHRTVSRKVIRQAVALPVLSPRRSPVHTNRHQLGSSCPMDGRQGVRTGGRARFRCLTRARAMKANLWKLTQRQHLREDSACADHTWATKTLWV